VIGYIQYQMTDGIHRHAERQRDGTWIYYAGSGGRCCAGGTLQEAENKWRTANLVLASKREAS